MPVNITCPACGLLCDDIEVSSATPPAMKNACPKGSSFFLQSYQAVSDYQALIGGKPATLDEAITKAAGILNDCKKPLFAGLGTEVQGMRAVMRLAQKTNAILDHMQSHSTVHNTRALQNSGWITTTFSEIKNRADLILAIGTDIASSHPRFFERLAVSKDRLSNNPSPEIIFLGANSEHGKNIHTHPEKLPEILNVMNALLNGKKIQAATIAGVSLADLQSLTEKLKQASYTAVIWSAASFKNSHADLAIQSIIQLIAKLNESTRAAGLPLTSGDGDSSVNSVSTWLSGYATRLSFDNGMPEYNSFSYAADKQLKNADALLWISTFNPVSPPESKVPLIAIGHPATQFAQQPDVFIPVGIPGIDHAGLMFRMDSSITLPLKKLRESTLPGLSDVIALLETKLNVEAAA